MKIIYLGTFLYNNTALHDKIQIKIDNLLLYYTGENVYHMSYKSDIFMSYRLLSIVMALSVAHELATSHNKYVKIN